MHRLIVTADYRQFTKLAAAAHFSSCIGFCDMPMVTMIAPGSAIGVSHMLERSSSKYNVVMHSICQYYCLSNTWHHITLSPEV